LRSEFGDGALLVRQTTACAQYRRIQANKELDEVGVHKLMRNAWFTELQLQMAAQAAELIPYSNHWAPVQLYYSVYLLLRAWFVASGQDVGANHASALRNASSDIRQRQSLYPSPWSLCVLGDPEKQTTEYLGLPDGVVITQVNSQRHTPPFWDSFAMFLRTTRKRQVSRSIDEWKSKRKKQRIDKSQRAQLVNSLPPTSLFNALYRLRIRSNYEDADAFLLSIENDAEAIEFHQAIRSVGWYTLLLLELLVAARVGRPKFGGWARGFLQHDSAGLADDTIGKRSQLILGHSA